MQKIIVRLFTITAITMLLVTISCTPPDPDLERRDCVVMLGDSIFALSDKEADYLEDLSGQWYRKYYISGAQMIDGAIATIPEQYQRARRINPNIRTVIGDGGGNDILIGGINICSAQYGSPISDECQQLLQDLRDTFWETAEKMVADGVENIVWQGYYYIRNKKLWQVLEVANQMFKDEFAKFKVEYPELNLVYVDMLAPFPKENAAGTTIIDGIHPNDTTSEKMAELIWDAMVENGIEQGDPCPSGGIVPGCG